MLRDLIWFHLQFSVSYQQCAFEIEEIMAIWNNKWDISDDIHWECNKKLAKRWVSNCSSPNFKWISWFCFKKNRFPSNNSEPLRKDKWNRDKKTSVIYSVNTSYPFMMKQIRYHTIDSLVWLRLIVSLSTKN